MSVDLFDNEKLDLNNEQNYELVSSDDEINEKYVTGEVRIVTEQARYPLDTIKTMIDSGKYNLQPIFQRRHRWDTVRRSRLIESLRG